MNYAHKTYTQGTEAWIREARLYVPGQVDDFILSIDIVDTEDPATLKFSQRDGDITNAKYVWNGDVTINVFRFRSSADEACHFQLDAFTDALRAFPYIMPVFTELEDVETIEDAIQVLERHGFVPSVYHQRAEGRKWREATTS